MLETALIGRHIVLLSASRGTASSIGALPAGQVASAIGVSEACDSVAASAPPRFVSVVPAATAEMRATVATSIARRLVPFPVCLNLHPFSAPSARSGCGLQPSRTTVAGGAHSALRRGSFGPHMGLTGPNLGLSVCPGDPATTPDRRWFGSAVCYGRHPLADARELEFKILGQLEVLRAGEGLDVRGPKQRGLLALLLLSANQVVSADRLIEALWGEAPSDKARHNLHANAERLRKGVSSGQDADGPGQVIITRSPGYVIRLRPEELDLNRFETLVGEGTDRLLAGDPAAASELLAEALGLWRGPPLAEFAYEPFAQTAIARLEELRLASVEWRVEADLALGRHAQLLTELDGLVREHPLRERLRAHHMLALYRAGRSAEALDTYQSARQVLAEELGIDPGPALQQVQEAILRQDPALDHAALASGVSPAAAPAASAEVSAATPERSLLVGAARRRQSRCPRRPSRAALQATLPAS